MDLALTPAQTRKKQSSRQNAGHSLGLALKEGQGEGSGISTGKIAFPLQRRARLLFLYKDAEALQALLPGMTLLEKDMAMLTRFGLKISFVGFYLKEIPLKLDEQSYFCSEKPGSYLYIPTYTND